jgi:hypothetical protein
MFITRTPCLQVSGQLAGIEAALAEQCKNISQIKGILAELLYLKGFEEVRAILTTFQSGWSSPPLSPTMIEHNTENSKQIFPEKELRGYSPNSYNYIHVSMSDLYIPLIGLHILLQENRWTELGNI